MPVRLPAEQALRKPGTYVVTVTANAGERQLLRQSVELAVGALLSVQARAFLTAQRLVLAARADPTAFPATDSEISLTLDGPTGRIAERTGPPHTAGGDLSIEVPGTRVPRGQLTGRAAVLRRGTGVRLSTEKVLEDPLQPAWLGTTEGLSRDVPAPWTPRPALPPDPRGAGRDGTTGVHLRLPGHAGEGAREDRVGLPYHAPRQLRHRVAARPSRRHHRLPGQGAPQPGRGDG